MEAKPFLLIQETKNIVEDSLSTMGKIWKKGEGKAVSTIGASRGLLTWWDKEKFSMHSPIENRNWIFIDLEDKESNEIIYIKSIYGPTL